MTRPTHDGEVVGTILVHNTTQHHNRSVATCRIPLAEGRFSPEVSRLHLWAGTSVGVGTVAGARWPDGSPRYLDVQVPVSVKPLDLKHIDLVATADAPETFRVPRAMAGALRGLELSLVVGDEVVPITGGPAEAIGEETGLLRTYRYRVRARNHPIWVELYGTLTSGQMLVRFDLDWGYSPGEGTDRPLTWDLPEVSFSVKGAVLALDHAEAKALDWVRSKDQTSNLVTLMGPGALAAGQSQSIRGRLLLWSSDTETNPWASLIRPEQIETLLSERERPLFCRSVGADWVQSRAFGPFGDLLPKQTPSEEEVVESGFQHWERMEDMPWEAPRLGCLARPSSTGSQEDFGILKLRREILSDATWPWLLIDRAVRQEACRPTHEREKDVSPVTSANRPDWQLTSGRPNKAIHRTVDALWYQTRSAFRPARTRGGMEWRPHDGEHWSINYLAGYAMLTGDPWAVRECHHKAELWLAEFNTYRHRGDWPPPARLVGRTLKAGCWLWLVTGRGDIRKAVKHWAEHHHIEWSKRVGELQIFAERGSWWAPWEESEAAAGFAAVYRCMGIASAAHISKIIAEAVVEYGIGYLDGRVVAAYHPPIHKPDGSLWTAQSESDLREHASISLTRWCVPAMVIAWVRGRTEGVRERAKLLLIEFLGIHTAPAAEIWDWLALEGFDLERLWEESGG